MKRELSPKLQKLIEMYRDGLGDKQTDIDAAWARASDAGWQGESLKALYDLVHKLAGSSGSYGFRDLSEVARVLDRRLSDTVAGETTFDPQAGQADYEARQAAFSRARDPNLVPDP